MTGAAAAVIPSPRKARDLKEWLVLRRGSRITAIGSEADFAARRLTEMLRDEFGVELAVDRARRGRGGEPCLLITPDGSSGAEVRECEAPEHDEGYALTVTPGAAGAWARTERGLLWAAMTLRMLAVGSVEGLALPCLTIHDWPRYRLRGFMIDSGRAPNSLAKIKRIIRICSAFKLNCLMFREGDDELNGVRYRTNPLGSENPFALTMDEIEEMAGYAWRHGVTLVPEIESLGHSTAKSRHFPHLVSGGFEHDYGFVRHTRKSHLAPADPRSYDLLRSIYEEWLAVLPEPLLHLGLDEVRLGSEEQARHFEGLLALIMSISAAGGREVTPIVWSDAPSSPSAWQGRLVRCLWNYGDGEPNGPLNTHLVRQRAPVLLAGGSREPVLMAGGSGSLHTPCSKSPYEGAAANLHSWAQWGNSAPNALGLLAVQWGGNNTDAWLPDFVTAADFAWTVPNFPVDPEEQLRRVEAQLGRLKDAVCPHRDEVERPCWDGIWLEDGDWGEDIVTGARRDSAAMSGGGSGCAEG